MPKYKVVFTDYYYPDNLKEVKILQQLDSVEILDCTRLKSGGVKQADEVIQYVRDADAIIVQFAEISKKVIDQLEKCRIISRYAIGVDNIDVEAAKKKGIVVSNVPDYCLEEVSDSTIAHLLNCLRKISIANYYFHNRTWDYGKIKPLHRLANLKVGLVAFGHIARRVAEKLRPYRLKMFAYDPYFKDTQLYDWVDFVSLKHLLAESDIVSIHAPYTKETHHLIDEEKLGWMKDGVIIINTSRGGVIDEKALEKAILTGKVAMAGLDVLDSPDIDYYRSPLANYPEKVIITPHMAWYSEEAISELQTKTALNVYEVLKNGRPLYRV